MSNRTEKKAILKELDRFAEALPNTPFPLPPKIQHVAGLSKRVSSILRSRQNPNRASDAARFVSTVFDATAVALKVQDELACKPGCSMCCKNYVSATPPSIFAIVRYLRETGQSALPRISEIRDLELVTRGLSSDQRFDGRQPCALLKDDKCSVYSARPPACRGFTSFSLEACIRSFTEGVDDIPTCGELTMLRASCDQGLFAAMRANDLPTHAYELSHAVIVALDRSDSEEAWLRGEDIFKDVARDEIGGAEGFAMLDAIMEAILSAIDGKLIDGTY